MKTDLFKVGYREVYNREGIRERQGENLELKEHVNNTGTMETKRLDLN